MVAIEISATAPRLKSCAVPFFEFGPYGAAYEKAFQIVYRVSGGYDIMYYIAMLRIQFRLIHLALRYRRKPQ